MSMCPEILLRSNVRNFGHGDDGFHKLVEPEASQTGHLNAGNITPKLLQFNTLR